MFTSILSFVAMALSVVHADKKHAKHENRELKKVELTVDGHKRTALVYAPESAKHKPTPMIFGFHGHGGSAKEVAGVFDYQKHWPEAISVYMQGLPIVGRTDPEGKHPGWQHLIGQADDRDLKFFDALLDKLKKEHKVDEHRIYATGHSNGGGFTYLLWAARGDTFAAFAPSGTGLMHDLVKSIKPKPALQVAGEHDTTIPFKSQREAMDKVRKINGCQEKGQPWHKKAVIFESETGTPFVELIHPGAHEFDKAAPPLIVDFFKKHSTK